MLFYTHKFIEISCATFEWALTLVIPTPHSYMPSHSSPSYWGDSRLQECRPVPTVPNDCTHKKGFNSLSQLSPHTPACKGRKKNKTAQDSWIHCPSTISPPSTMTHPPPSTVAPTFLLTPAACIKDPSEVSLATFTSERGLIMERLGRRMRRQRGTHRCGGAKGGGRKEQRPIVAPATVTTQLWWKEGRREGWRGVRR